MLLNDVQETLLETSNRINRIVAAEDAHFPGEIRTGGVEVSTIRGQWKVCHYPWIYKKTEKTPITEIKHAKELREEWFTNDD